MTRFLLRRLAGGLLSLLLVSLLTFTAFQAIPGDAALAILGTDATPQTVAAWRHALGLDLPLPLQYARWLLQLLRGDLGRSLRWSVPVLQLVGRALPVTVALAAVAVLVTLLLAVPLGVAAAARRGGLLDWTVLVLSQLGLALPSFWLGLLLLLLFALKLNWLPAGGWVPWGQSPRLALASLLLPGLALGLARTAALLRIVRASLLEALAREYVRTARAKGMAERRVLYRHALRGALLPALTLFGLQLGELLAGSVVIERVFALPGMGRLLLDAIAQRDLVTAQGVVLVAAAGIVLINLAVDLLYARLDPRIAY